MGSAGLGGKYGNGRTHDPRCSCPDCSQAFAKHNEATHCTCVDCVQHREIYAEAPRVTRPEEIAAQYERTRQAWHESERFNREAEQRRASAIANTQREAAKKTMGNLNICERPGCNAIIKGDAAARVELETSIGADATRTLYVLCPPCVSDVDALLHECPTSDRERAYDTPYGGYKAPETETGDDVKAATTEQLAAELLTRLMKDKQLTTKVLESGE